MPEKKKSKAQLDAMAREAGYPSYEAWKGHYEKYRKTKRVVGPAKKGNFLQRMFEKFNPHPIGMVANKVVPVLEEANRKNQR